MCENDIVYAQANHAIITLKYSKNNKHHHHVNPRTEATPACPKPKTTTDNHQSLTRPKHLMPSHPLSTTQPDVTQKFPNTHQ